MNVALGQFDSQFRELPGSADMDGNRTIAVLPPCAFFLHHTLIRGRIAEQRSQARSRPRVSLVAFVPYANAGKQHGVRVDRSMPKSTRDEFALELADGMLAHSGVSFQSCASAWPK